MQRQHLLSTLAILACAALAIVARASLPAKVDEARLDGFLVQKFGFPVVAGSYFVLNMFIGLVKSGAFADAVTRSVLDVVARGAAMALAAPQWQRRSGEARGW